MVGKPSQASGSAESGSCRGHGGAREGEGTGLRRGSCSGGGAPSRAGQWPQNVSHPGAGAEAPSPGWLRSTVPDMGHRVPHRHGAAEEEAMTTPWGETNEPHATACFLRPAVTQAQCPRGKGSAGVFLQQQCPQAPAAGRAAPCRPLLGPGLGPREEEARRLQGKEGRGASWCRVGAAGGEAAGRGLLRSRPWHTRPHTGSAGRWHAPPPACPSHGPGGCWPPLLLWASALALTFAQPSPWAPAHSQPSHHSAQSWKRRVAPPIFPSLCTTVRALIWHGGSVTPR